MNIFISLVFRELWLHKFRSGLAVFCVAFGTLITVLLLALNAGFHEANKREIGGLANNTLVAWFGKKAKSYHGYPRGKISEITTKDVMELPKIFSSIEAASPQIVKPAVLSYGGKVYKKTLLGTGTEYFTRLVKTKFTLGSRFFNSEDIKNAARVAVVSKKTKELLFGHNRDGLGEKFLINNVLFTVIGVLASDDNNHFNEDVIIIPYQLAEKLYGNKYIDEFIVLLQPGKSLVQAEQLLRGYFSEKYHFDKNDKEAMGFCGSGKFYNFLYWFLIGVQLFLSGCGLMVLSVGGISVANMMFLTVTDRIYEIGLRKALGATDQQIFLQLFFEVLILVAIGGGLGMMLAFFTTMFLQNITLPEWLGVPTLSWATTFVTMFILALVGLITSFSPALKAAKIDPAEALIYE